jgi:hypothetical protein
MKQITIIILCALVVLFSSCNKEEDENNTTEKESNGSMTCKLNDGTSWEAKTLQNTLLIGTDRGVDAKRLDIRGTAADGSQLILTVSDTRDGKEGEGFRTDTIYADVALNEGNYLAICTFITDTLTTSSGMSSDGYVYVSECDAENHIISGNFIFHSPYSLGSITEGQFTGVSYKIVRSK